MEQETHGGAVEEYCCMCEEAVGHCSGPPLMVTFGTGDGLCVMSL